MKRKNKAAKKIETENIALSKARQLFVRAFLPFRDNPRLFFGITLTYAFLSLVLVKGFSSGVSITQLKESASEFANSGGGQLRYGAAIFSYIASSSSETPSEASGIIQTIILLLCSLALIWALRQFYAGKTPTVKQAFYKGAAPVIPYLLVLVIIGLQLLPLALGGSVFDLFFGGELETSQTERIIVTAALFFLGSISLYFVSSSIFGALVATLPNMTPFTALDSARKLVAKRRLQILRKLIFLPVAMMLILAAVMIPIILVLPGLAGWMFFALSAFTFSYSHSYIYALYRELL